MIFYVDVHRIGMMKVCKGPCLPDGKFEQAEKPLVLGAIVQLLQGERPLQPIHVVVAKGAEEGAVRPAHEHQRQHPARVAR